MIANLYVECGEQPIEQLYEVLTRAGFAIYDATAFDPYTAPGLANNYPTLESIEGDLECK